MPRTALGFSLACFAGGRRLSSESSASDASELLLLSELLSKSESLTLMAGARRRWGLASRSARRWMQATRSLRRL